MLSPELDSRWCRRQTKLESGQPRTVSIKTSLREGVFSCQAVKLPIAHCPLPTDHRNITESKNCWGFQKLIQNLKFENRKYFRPVNGHKSYIII